LFNLFPLVEGDKVIEKVFSGWGRSWCSAFRRNFLEIFQEPTRLLSLIMNMIT